MKKLILMTAMTMLVVAGCKPKDAIKTDISQDIKPVAETIQAVPEQDATGQAIIAADNSGWMSYGRTYDEQRFSPLSAVNTETVSDLGLAWSHDLNSSRGIEATPIVHEGYMYVTSTYNVVHALNARTGDLIWSYEPEIDMVQASNACCDLVNRGVAVWGNMVFTATIDGRLIALDAKDGGLMWEAITIDKTKPYTITGAPRVVKGKVIIGNGGAELGVRGYISAYDVRTGRLDWRFYTVPGNPADGFENETMAMAAETWNGEYWKAGGGGTAWDSMAYDPELDLLYFGVGNGSPWNQSIRSPGGGDNLFLSSMVAVKPDTGEYVWHYQTTPGETWDYTATQHMILADLEIEGAKRKVIMQAPKNGFFYVIDRETGAFISGENFVDVNWATGIDPETGRPIEVEAARYYGKEPYLQLPGPLGAHNWHPMSFSQDTGLVYIPAQEGPWVYGDRAKYEHKPGTWNTGTDFTFALLPSDKATFKALKSMLKGRLLAWDPVKQEEAWTFEHKGPWNGGVLSTGGNLVFQGTADAHFAAYNAKTGEQVWKYFTQSGIVAAPITYELDGDQYVAVASGYGGSFVLGFGGVLPSGSDFNSGRLLVFKLGADGKLPTQRAEAEVEFELPAPVSVDAATMTKGKQAYANSCAVCHGDHAYASGLTPNLRYSGVTKDAELWQEVLRDGLLAENGMPNFGDVYDAETIEAVRAYVIAEAHSDMGKEFYDEVSLGQDE